MYTDKEPAAGAGEPPKRRRAKPGWQDPLRRIESMVPAFAAGLVAVSALAVAVMASRSDAPEPLDAQALQADASTRKRHEVVNAPPLKAPTPSAGPVQQKTGETPTTTQALGAGPACLNCGVVQMVVAVHGYAQPQPSAYQMHIRMDNGSLRTVEQRGALAAGSRVIVERDTVRVLAPRPDQG